MSIRDNDGLLAAVSAAVVDADQKQVLLLRSIVTVARAIFDAGASSIFLLDEGTGELVFEAVAGAGEGSLVGQRFLASRGVAGWVLAASEPLLVSDLASTTMFARDLAERTGYVPRALMAAPLLRDEGAIGVLEVLDAAPNRTGALAAMDLLGLFAQQAALALDVVQRGRSVRRMLTEDGAELAELVSVARALDALDSGRRAAGLRMLSSVRDLLAPL